MATRKTHTPSEEQLKKVLGLFELDAAQHADAAARLGSIGWSRFEDVASPQVSVPGTRTLHSNGYGLIKIIPHGPSGLTLKARLIDASDKPRSLELELYPLDDFEAVMRTTGAEIINNKVVDAIRSVQGAFSAQEILEMFKASLEGSDLGTVFKADRSAAIMQDSIEQAPEKPVKAFFTRGR